MEGKRRKDQWTEVDDTRLAEIVLQAVKTGGTQLEAFEQAYRAQSHQTSVWL